MNARLLSLAPEALNSSCTSELKMSWSPFAPTTSVGTVTCGRFDAIFAYDDKPDQVDSHASGVTIRPRPNGE